MGYTMKKLSTRQAQVQDLLVAGLTVAQISVELRVTVGTVRTHVEQLYRKRGFKSRRDLVHLELDEANLAVKLTRKQLQVLRSILAGKTFLQIAMEMGITLGTVHTHCNKLYKKMGVATRAQLVAVIAKRQASSNGTGGHVAIAPPGK